MSFTAEFIQMTVLLRAVFPLQSRGFVCIYTKRKMTIFGLTLSQHIQAPNLSWRQGLGSKVNRNIWKKQFHLDYLVRDICTYQYSFPCVFQPLSFGNNFKLRGKLQREKQHRVLPSIELYSLGLSSQLGKVGLQNRTSPLCFLPSFGLCEFFLHYLSAVTFQVSEMWFQSSAQTGLQPLQSPRWSLECWLWSLSLRTWTWW